MQAHPVQLVVEDDLRRNRLTVFFRIILAIPHLFWAGLWTIATFFVAIVTWVTTLIAGHPPAALHRYMCSYIRYITHLEAYLHRSATRTRASSGRRASTRSTSGFPSRGRSPG